MNGSVSRSQRDRPLDRFQDQLLDQFQDLPLDGFLELVPAQVLVLGRGFGLLVTYAH